MLPESVVSHDCGEGAHVGAPQAPVVEEGEGKVEEEGAPDGDVIPDCPVLGVQGNLITSNHQFLKDKKTNT